MIVIHQDLRVLGFCNKGAREFFERHEINWWLFLQHGVDADILIATNDSMALDAVEQAKKRLSTSGDS